MYSRRQFLRFAGTAAGAVATGCARGPHPSSAIDWGDIRRGMMLPSEVVYLNPSTLGACPRTVVEAMTAHLRDYESRLAEYDYSPGSEPPMTGYTPLDERRKPMAEFVDADLGEIAFTQNATMGMNFVAHGLPLTPGDEVLMTDQEHPGGRCPWQLQEARRGVIVRQIPAGPPATPAEIVRRFSQAITQRTRVVMVSHITWALGLVLPVTELCALARSHGAWAVVDGAQAVGQLHVNVTEIGCDFYVSSPHKWLLAPKGCGMLYVRRALLDQVATTLASSEWNNRKWDAARLQQFGTGSLTQLVGLQAAIDFHNRLGRGTIEARIRALTRRLRDGLASLSRVRITSSTHPDMVAGMTTFQVEGRKPVEVQNALWARKMRVRAVGDGLGVRVGTHVYVLERDIDRLLEVVKQLA